MDCIVVQFQKTERISYIATLTTYWRNTIVFAGIAIVSKGKWTINCSGRIIRNMYCEALLPIRLIMIPAIIKYTNNV